MSEQALSESAINISEKQIPALSEEMDIRKKRILKTLRKYPNIKVSKELLQHLDPKWAALC